ncbi:MAG: NAD(P)/FAD-dependent oxidoreductase [Daejeonella sp.]|uniref:NAD(P)/FAD-dependent oxidoreductase n=1 Tax=Daejeonella sp. TaxID=2805397 RepID=UPI0027335CDD|nr:NAD(P)/FAD-dependent oxidoreductase [Daejeonella sp.]MDP3470057.1 NAD(P)/FAD-dependent oxidoreductase [Daejeonella sp.]
MEKPMNKSTAFPRVIIIGGGFGGIEIAKRLKDKEVEIIMLDRHNYHTFQPLLYQVATGGLEADSIAFPLRRIFKNQKNFTFRVTEVERIEPEKKIVHTSIGEIEYDFLIIATGSETNYFGQKEIEHFSMPMKSIPEALNLRSMILQNLEEALIESDPVKKSALLQFVVVGGGPTGVELSGSLAELKKHVLPTDYPELRVDDIKVYLIEGSPELLGSMSSQASQKAKEFLQTLGVEVFTDLRVESYDGKVIKLSNGQAIDTKNVLWSAGVKGATLEGLKSESITRGNRILVDEFNRVMAEEYIFAIGDVAACISQENPNGLPGVAPVAIQQGTQLAKNIIHFINNEEPEPFKYFDKGSMATVGRNLAVVDIGKIRFQGIFAWFVWMFVHLMSLVGFRNKVVTFVNWVWSYFSYDRGTRLIIRRFNRESMTEDTYSK